MTRATVTRWSGWRMMAALAAMIAAIAAAAPARAQGTSEFVPDPISSAELSGYMKRVGATEPQRQAAAALHDEYKDQFKQLREGEIQKLLDEMKQLEGGGMGRIPNRKDVEKLLDNRKQVLARIESLDNSLFSMLQPLLSDEQQALLPRARLARERVRHTQRGMMPMMGSGTDLSAMVLDMNLEGAEAGVADAILQGYELRLTNAIKALHEVTLRAMLDMVEGLEAAGLTNEKDFTDPQKMKQSMETMRAIMQDMMVKPLKAGAEVSQLNRQTYHTLASNLPRERGRELGEKFFKKAYPEAFYGGQQGGVQFEKILRYKDLSDEQRQAIVEIQDSYVISVERVHEQMADVIDESRKDMGMMMMGGGEGHKEREKKLNELRTRKQELAAGANSSINGLLGDEAVKKIVAAPDAGAPAQTVQGPGGKITKAEGEEATLTTESSDGTVTTTIAPADSGPDQFLPGPIKKSEAQRYAQRLGLEQADLVVIDQLHADYRKAYQALHNAEFKAVGEAQQAVWSGGETSSPDQLADQMLQARKTALAAIQRVDEQFFNDVESMLPATDATPAAVQRIRQARERAIYNRGGTTYSFGPFGPSGADTIDLTALLDQQRLSADALAASEATLQAYESAATGALKTRYETSLELQKAQDKSIIESRRAQAAGEDQMTAGMRYQEVWRETASKMGTVGKVVTDLNRQTLAKLLASLPSDAGATLRAAYNRKAYPRIFEDKRTAESRVAGALNLPSLSADQRGQVEEIAKLFHVSYNDLCEKMIVLQDKAPSPTSFEPGEWRDWQRVQNEIQKLKFERDEVSSAAIRKLRAVLNAEQVAALGGLEELKKEPKNPWEFD